MRSKRTIAVQIGIGVVVFVVGSLIVSKIQSSTSIGARGGFDG